MTFLANPFGEFPLNDDWVYSLAVKSILEDGTYRFPSFSSANVGPQLYWGALFCLPYGFSFTALRLSTLTLGALGVLMLYAITRQLGASRSTALLGATTLAVNPLYFALANTFMTDIPFVSVTLVSLYFLLRGLDIHDVPALALGILAALVAILIRQLGVVLLVAISLAYMIKNGFTRSNILLACTVIAAGFSLHFVYQHWLISAARTPILTSHSDLGKLLSRSALDWSRSVTKASVNVLVYSGFLIAPFALGFTPQRPSGLKPRMFWYIKAGVIAFAVALLIALWCSDKILPWVGNILLPSGLGPLTLYDTYNLGINYPIAPLHVATFWLVSTGFAAAGAGFIVYLFILSFSRADGLTADANARSRSSQRTLVSAAAAAYLAAILLIAGAHVFFDRYVLLLLPLAVALASTLALDDRSALAAARRSLAFALIGCYAIFSVLATRDYLSWNRTRWVALHELAEGGLVLPNKIDGGYEFNGWFNHGQKYSQRPGKSWWWVDDDEYIIASGPVPGYEEIKRYTFCRWLSLSESSVVVLRRTSEFFRK